MRRPLLIATLIAAAATYVVVAAFDLNRTAAVFLGLSLGVAAALIVHFARRTKKGVQ
jgi:hypothetical protein